MSNGFNILLVVVDYILKIAHYISTTFDINSKQLAKLFFNNIFRLYGILDSVVLDQGMQFTSDFTWVLVALVGIYLKLSTSFHPQTDGKTECINTIILQYLHRYFNYQ